MKIGFQGVRGAYSEAAIYKYFGEKKIKVNSDIKKIIKNFC